MIFSTTVILPLLLRIFSNPLANVFQKQLTLQKIHPFFVSFATYFLLSLVCAAALFFIEIPPLSVDFWIFLVLAGMAGALGNSLLVKAIHYGDLSVLGPVNSYKPVIGIFSGMIFLSEFPNLWGILGMMLIIGGSYFVLDTTEERFSLKLFRNRGIQFRMLAMISSAIEAVWIKKIIMASSVNMAMVSWCLGGAVFSGILLRFSKVNIHQEIHFSVQNRNVCRFMLLIVCIGLMQWSTNEVLGQIPVGYALSLFQLSTVVSIFLGHHFFHEKHIGRKILGSAIMILGSVVIILLNGH